MAAARFLNKDSASDIKRKSRSQPDLFRVTVEASKTSSFIRNKSIDDELLEICQFSGLKMSQEVFNIILDLLRLNVNPNTIADVLKKMTAQKSTKDGPKASGSLAVPRHGSDNVGSKAKSGSAELAVDDSKVPRAQSLY